MIRFLIIFTLLYILINALPHHKRDKRHRHYKRTLQDVVPTTSLPVAKEPSTFVTEPLCPNKMDMVLTIDSSGSVLQVWNDIIDNAQIFLSNFQVSDQIVRVGIMDFSAVSNVYTPLDSNNTDENAFQMLDVLRSIPQNGETWAELGLDRANHLFQSASPPRNKVRKVLVIYTDGVITSKDYASIKSLSKVLQENNVEIYVVKVNNNTKDNAIEAMASSPLHIFHMVEQPAIGQPSLHTEICWSGTEVITTTTPMTTSKSKGKDTCSLPKEVGPCSKVIPRYRFNKSTGQCEIFYYGGCGGNTNNFGSLRECEESCKGDNKIVETTVSPPETTDKATNGKDTCSLPKDVGPCSKVTPRYRFNKSTGQCEIFYYGGCGGNSNNFGSLRECQESCKDQLRPEATVAPPTTTSSTTTTKAVRQCNLSKEVGPCYGNIPRYTYNKLTGQCEIFHYGGCDGNANNFVTLEECERSCKVKPETTRSPPVTTTTTVASTKSANNKGACSQPKEVGPCYGNSLKYTFNKATGQCEMFNYGGCGGNSNNFPSNKECEKTCKGKNTDSSAVTTTISPTGTPTISATKCEIERERAQWFIDSKVPTLVPVFVPECTADGHYKEIQHHEGTGYYWCVDKDTGDIISGTKTVDELPKCSGDVNPQCMLPKLVGPCRAALTRFYFDIKSGTCEQFTFGGCNGNKNNFRTFDECQQACGKATKCLIDREKAKQDKTLFSPQCAEDGSFKPLQHYENGSTFCVDPVKGLCIEKARKGVNCTEKESSKELPTETVSTTSLPEPETFTTSLPEPVVFTTSLSESAKIPEPVPEPEPEPTPKKIDETNTKPVVIALVYTATPLLFTPDTTSKVVEPEPEPEVEPPPEIDIYHPRNPCSLELDFAKQRAGMRANAHFVGAFLPQCDEKGDYKLLQIHSSTGMRWCVDTKTGHEIDGTRTTPSTPDPDCTKASNSTSAGTPHVDPTPKPEVEPPHVDPTPTPEVEPPHVDPIPTPEVELKLLNSSGNNVTENSTIATNDRSENTTSVTNDRLCEVERNATYPVMMGAFLPDCDENGNYKPLQQHGSTGMSWCVDVKIGREIYGTRVGPGIPVPECKPDLIVHQIITPPTVATTTVDQTTTLLASMINATTSSPSTITATTQPVELNTTFPTTTASTSINATSTSATTTNATSINATSAPITTVIAQNNASNGTTSQELQLETEELKEFAKNCPYSIGTNITKIGCYNDDQQIPRPLPVLLARDITIVPGQVIKNADWKVFIKAFLCKCAIETRKRGWYTFGIQNYGACYSGPDEGRFDEDGESKEDMCVNEDRQPCEKNDHQSCAGIMKEDDSKKMLHANYIYTFITKNHKEIYRIEYDKKKRKRSTYQKSLRYTKH